MEQFYYNLEVVKKKTPPLLLFALQGVLVGEVAGFFMALWIAVGAFFNPPYNPRLPTSVDGCLFEGNVSTSSLFTTDLLYMTTDINIIDSKLDGPST